MAVTTRVLGRIDAPTSGMAACWVVNCTLGAAEDYEDDTGFSLASVLPACNITACDAVMVIQALVTGGTEPSAGAGLFVPSTNTVRLSTSTDAAGTGVNDYNPIEAGDTFTLLVIGH